MNARAFLVRGLLAGLIAGLAAFLVANVVGEPHVESAIALEESAAPAAHDDGHSHSHDESDSDSEEAVFEVSRANQSTWGLLTGSLAIGVAPGRPWSRWSRPAPQGDSAGCCRASRRH
ncbi:CbtA family protein [Nocardioides sp. B-3]|uniref:CbtA family protein n=1 Tax=Nocardioides sp. B-3 TaxID=2895565 RepID=UPI0021520D5A|nr:CbtA family protein [Nocardioides sp. B-3]